MGQVIVSHVSEIDDRGLAPLLGVGPTTLDYGARDGAAYGSIGVPAACGRCGGKRINTWFYVSSVFNTRRAASAGWVSAFRSA